MENEDQIIETVDEEGNVVKFDLYDIIEVDNQEYGLLFPLNEDDALENENDVVIMRLKQEDDGYVFEVIEDDDEFNKVTEYINKLAEEFDGEE